MAIRYLIVFSICLMTSVAALAAPPTAATIDSPGVGTVDVVPEFVEFWIRLAGPGKSNAESADAAQAFEATLRKELETRKIIPAALDFSGLAIPDATKRASLRSAKLRFSAVPFKSVDDGPKQFAKLCDDVLELAAAVPGAVVEGPVLGVENTKTIEQAAVTLATEKAYPAAEAIATAMKTQIVGIQSASVISLTWNQDLTSKAAQPDIRRLNCTAKVRIWYLYPTPPGG